MIFSEYKDIDLNRLNDTKYVVETIFNLSNTIIDIEIKLDLAIRFLKVIYKPEDHSESIGVFIKMVEEDRKRTF